MSKLNYSPLQVVVGSLLAVIFTATAATLVFGVGASDPQGWFGIIALALGAVLVAGYYARPLFWRLGLRFTRWFLRAVYNRLPAGNWNNGDSDAAYRRREKFDDVQAYLGWCIKRTENP